MMEIHLRICESPLGDVGNRLTSADGVSGAVWAINNSPTPIARQRALSS
jgi:hypothetical protein